MEIMSFMVLFLSFSHSGLWRPHRLAVDRCTTRDEQQFFCLHGLPAPVRRLVLNPYIEGVELE
jgi:hypothetical protein